MTTGGAAAAALAEHVEAVCKADVADMIAVLVGATVTVAARTDNPAELLAIAVVALEEALVAIVRGSHRPIPRVAEVAS